MPIAAPILFSKVSLLLNLLCKMKVMLTFREMMISGMTGMGGGSMVAPQVAGQPKRTGPPSKLCHTLQHTATHCNILQHTATYCNTLQHTAAYCNTLQYTATRCISRQDVGCPEKTSVSFKSCTATRCNKLQYTATHKASQEIWPSQ